MPRTILLDTDTGVDDALAILLALRCPELEVAAITTVAGNTYVERCTENALRVVELCGAEVRVARGEAAPLQAPLFIADDIHAKDGLGGVTTLRDASGNLRYPPPKSAPVNETATAMIARLCQERDGLTIVAVGPLTNIAKAMLDYPHALRGVKEIIIMGGVFDVRGNTTPTAEFNLYVDPHAADLVFRFGVPVMLVPLDVTEKCILRASDIPPDQSGLNCFIRDLTRFTMDRHERRRGFNGMYLHDPLAVAAAIDDSFVHCETGVVCVETSGEMRGMTTLDPAHKSSTRIALQVDALRFEAFFCGRVLCAS